MSPRRRYRIRRNPPRARAKLHIEGFTAAQLGAQLGVSARTVRYYTAERLLPAPQFRGRATRYLREHLVQLAAIRHLQQGKRLALDTIRQRLARLTGPELEQLAFAAFPQLAPPQPVPVPATPSTEADLVSVRWQRVTVLPGLEIQLQDGAGDAMRAIANELAKLGQQLWFHRQPPGAVAPAP